MSTPAKMPAETPLRSPATACPPPALDPVQAKELLAPLGDELGDPMPWVLAQACTVRLALELIEAQEGGDAQVRDVLIRHQGISIARGLDVETLQQPAESSTFGHRILRHRPSKRAATLLGDLANPNLNGLRWKLIGPDGPEDPARMHIGFWHSALFEVVWWHVANAAVGGRHGSLVRLCELPTCRAPFIVTDDRQPFCPADYIYTDKAGRQRPGRSRCAALFQKRHGSGAPKP